MKHACIHVNDCILYISASVVFVLNEALKIQVLILKLYMDIQYFIKNCFPDYFCVH